MKPPRDQPSRPADAPNLQFETMTKAKCGEYAVRVWCEASEFRMGPDAGVLQVLGGSDGSVLGIKAALERLGERVAAFEILDKRGNGGVQYPDWK